MGKNTIYFDSFEVRERYRMKKTRFFDLRNNPDPSVRFPRPTIKQGVVPLWSLDDLEAYEERAREQAEKEEERKADRRALWGLPPKKK